MTLPGILCLHEAKEGVGALPTQAEQWLLGFRGNRSGFERTDSEFFDAGSAVLGDDTVSTYRAPGSVRTGSVRILLEDGLLVM